MAQYNLGSSKLVNLASAVRSKLSETDEYLLSEIPGKIRLLKQSTPKKAPGTYDRNDEQIKPWPDLKRDGDVIVDNGIMSTPDDISDRFSNPDVISLVVDPEVEGISEEVISGTLVKEIHLPDTVEDIDPNAFTGANELTLIDYTGEAEGYPWGGKSDMMWVGSHFDVGDDYNICDPGFGILVDYPKMLSDSNYPEWINGHYVMPVLANVLGTVKLSGNHYGTNPNMYNHGYITKIEKYDKNAHAMVTVYKYDYDNRIKIKVYQDMVKSNNHVFWTKMLVAEDQTGINIIDNLDLSPEKEIRITASLYGQMFEEGGTTTIDSEDETNYYCKFPVDGITSLYSRHGNIGFSGVNGGYYRWEFEQSSYGNLHIFLPLSETRYSSEYYTVVLPKSRKLGNGKPAIGNTISYYRFAGQ